MRVSKVAGCEHFSSENGMVSISQLVHYTHDVAKQVLLEARERSRKTANIKAFIGMKIQSKNLPQSFFSGQCSHPSGFVHHPAASPRATQPIPFRLCQFTERRRCQTPNQPRANSRTHPSPRRNNCRWRLRRYTRSSNWNERAIDSSVDECCPRKRRQSRYFGRKRRVQEHRRSDSFRRESRPVWGRLPSTENHSVRRSPAKTRCSNLCGNPGESASHGSQNRQVRRQSSF